MIFFLKVESWEGQGKRVFCIIGDISWVECGWFFLVKIKNVVILVLGNIYLGIVVQVVVIKLSFEFNDGLVRELIVLEGSGFSLRFV